MAQDQRDPRLLTDQELAAEHAGLQAWLLGGASSEAGNQASVAYLSRLEAVIAARNPARIAAAEREQSGARRIERFAVATLVFPPVGLSVAQGELLSEFGHGVLDGIAEQPDERAARLKERFLELYSPKGPVADKLEFTKGYLHGIGAGMWHEVEGIFDLLLLLPRLQGELNQWLIRQALSFPGFGDLARKGALIYQDLENITTKASADLKAFFLSPSDTLARLSDALDSLIRSALEQTYQAGLSSVDKVLSFGESSLGEIGEQIGKIVGFVLFQVILVVATEGIGNAFAKGSGVLARLGRMAIDGAAEVAGAVRALIGEVAALFVRMKNGVLKAFEGTFDAIAGLARTVDSFVAEVAEMAEVAGQGGRRLAAEGPGAGGPNVFMSVEAKSGGAARPNPKVKELYAKYNEPLAAPESVPKPPEAAGPTPAPKSAEAGAPTQSAGAQKEPASLAPPQKARTPDDEFADFEKMLNDEFGATGPVDSDKLMQFYRHGSRGTVTKYLKQHLRKQAASDGVMTVGDMSMKVKPNVPLDKQIDAFVKSLEGTHSMPQTFGKKLPTAAPKVLPGGKYNPDDALVALTDKMTHTSMDQPWKDAFSALRKGGAKQATGQDVFDIVAEGIRKTPGMTEAEKAARVARLHDEMFTELGIVPSQAYDVPRIYTWQEILGFKAKTK